MTADPALTRRREIAREAVLLPGDPLLRDRGLGGQRHGPTGGERR